MLRVGGHAARLGREERRDVEVGRDRASRQRWGRPRPRERGAAFRRSRSTLSSGNARKAREASARGGGGGRRPSAATQIERALAGLLRAIARREVLAPISLSSPVSGL